MKIKNVTPEVKKTANIVALKATTTMVKSNARVRIYFSEELDTERVQIAKEVLVNETDVIPAIQFSVKE